MPLSSPRPVHRRPRRPRIASLALALALGLGAAAVARAQSLNELYEAARGYDASYQSARAEFEATRYRVEQFYALRRPRVDLAVNAGRSYSDTPDASTQNANNRIGSATFSGSQSVYNLPNDKSIEIAEKSLEAARTILDAAEQDLILRVSQAYFDVLAAQDTLATARGSLAAISEQVASAKRNFEVGTATITDTREAQARFDLARATEIIGENDLLTKRILLDQLVGRVNVSPKQLARPVALPPVSPPDVEEWVMRADAEHPQVRRARLALDVARLETEKAKAGHLPTVAVQASHGRGYSGTRGYFGPNNETGTPRRSYDNSSPTRNTSVAITLNLPLFAGFAIENRVKETVVLEDKSQSDLDVSRRSVAQATRTLFYNVISGTAQVVALEAAESSSLLALESTRLGYRVGVRVNIDVLNAQAQVFTTQAQLARARYDVVIAGLRLRQASGRLTPADVAAVNGLLQP